MRHLSALLAVLLLIVTPAQAQDGGSGPIRAFDPAMIERLGRVIAVQDTAAWIATDAIVAARTDLAKEGVRGWLVQPRDGRMLVRFIRAKGASFEAAYDVELTRDRKTTISTPQDRTLNATDLAAFTARQTALADTPKLCRSGYNSAVAKDPEGAGWLVWLLAPMTEANTMPVGGHYRYTISADGKSILRRDALSASCLVLPAPTPQSGQQAAAAVVTHPLSATPAETHVFLQLQSGRPLYVVTADKTLWKIDQGRLSKMDETKR